VWKVLKFRDDNGSDSDRVVNSGKKIQPPENGKRGKLLSSVIKSGFRRSKGNITGNGEEWSRKWRKSAGSLLKLAQRPLVWGNIALMAGLCDKLDARDCSAAILCFQSTATVELLH
jgi:hypothetical protein